MEKTFFISGIGGQGVQVLCKSMATVVDDCGMNMCLYPWYQGQRRGGATYGRLIISDERVGAPEKRSYDFVVLLETGMSVNKFCGLTRKDLDFKNRSIRVDHQLIRERGGNFTVPPFP